MATERDWGTYNDALVRRGYIGIDPSMLDEWGRELRRENRGKVGLPYRYPESSSVGEEERIPLPHC